MIAYQVLYRAQLPLVQMMILRQLDGGLNPILGFAIRVRAKL